MDNINNFKPNIVILGSCVTNDIFRTVHNVHYKEDINLLFSIVRTSIISQMSPKVKYDSVDLEILPKNQKNNFISNCIKNDFDKSFFKKINEKVDYLIIDFYFECLFGVVSYEGGGKYVTNNTWDLYKTPFFKKNKPTEFYSLEENPEEFYSLWKKNIHQFFDFMNKNQPGIKIILNRVKLVNQCTDEKGDIHTFSNEEWIPKLEIINPYLEKMENYTIKNFNIDVIDCRDIMENDVNHIWGLYAVHYKKNYYNLALRKLLKIFFKNNYNTLSQEILKKDQEIINLKEIMHNRVDVEKLKKFLTGRIDIKNHGNQTNSIEIVECSDENINLEYPNWFSDDKGQGIVLQSFSCEINLKIKCIGDGLLNIDLRGIDIRDNKNNKIQLPIEFNNFFVNNKKVMTSVICTHENKFTYRKDVKDSEKVEVIVKWYPINYLSNYI